MQYYMTPGKHGLGWLRDLPDQRDQIFKPIVTVASVEMLPPTVDLRPTCPAVYDQGQLGSCTANALAAAFDFDRHKQGKAFMEPSRLFVYWNERDLEGTVLSDAGAAIRDGIKVLISDGVPPEKEWPYDISTFTLKPSKKSYADALKNQALTYQRILRPATNLVGDMLSCLAAGYPFVTGISVYDSFETAESAKTGTVPLPGKGESLLGGHAVLVVGYNRNRELFLCRNSWGIGWGMGGYFTLPFSYLANPSLASDQWVIRTVEA